tara:strand:- start:4660 stop:4776 length:117 start_codon:yes stop_codon:yes gene_type:complete
MGQRRRFSGGGGGIHAESRLFQLAGQPVRKQPVIFDEQ